MDTFGIPSALQNKFTAELANYKGAEITPVDKFDGWYAKRDDSACSIGADFPSGSKVRQYIRMAESSSKDAVMLVGCSAFAAQQIYVADCAKRMDRKAIVLVPKRKERSVMTQWAEYRGAEIIEVTPGYPSVYRCRAREMAKKLNGCVRWNREMAIVDTAIQVKNLPKKVKRVVVPVGSGLVASGILLGLALQNRLEVSVLAVSVSTMIAKASEILSLCSDRYSGALPKLDLICLKKKYSSPEVASLPNDVLLDPYYAAKAFPFVQADDCLWVTGYRGSLRMDK